MRVYEARGAAEQRPILTSLAPEPRQGPVRVQPKLVVGPAGDPAEAAADRLADRFAHHSVTGWRAGGLLAPAVTSWSGDEVDEETARAITSARRAGSPLAEAARAPVEDAFGTDFSRVRVHTDSRAGELCERVQAKAFTVGSDIFFRRGRPDPARATDRHLLAHELAHVVQQTSPAGAGVIRRTWLDGERDWEADTDVTFPGTITRVGRSPLMKQIDLAVEQAQIAYGAGRIDALDRSLVDLQRAITAWKGKRSKGKSRVRDEFVTRLATETHKLRGSITTWRDGYHTALEKARTNRKLAVQWLADGRQAYTDDDLYETGTRLRNACEWIQQGRTKLYVLTSTPDGDYRAQLHLNKRTRAEAAGHTGYFPNPARRIGAYDEPFVGYDPDNAIADPNVVIHTITNAWRKPRHIVVTDVTFGEGTNDDRAVFFQSLRHEVQHAADRFQGRELTAGIRGSKSPRELAAQRALHLYKTEYRAHHYQADPALDVEEEEVEIVGELGLRWTPRQVAVLERVRKRYKQVATAWGREDRPPTPWQRWFRRKVHAYRDPDTEGFNKYNSLRIDALYDALDQVRPSEEEPLAPKVQTVYRVAQALHADDVDYLTDPDEAPMLRAKIRRHLTGDAYEQFRKLINGLFPDAPAPVQAPALPPPPPPAPEDDIREATLVTPRPENWRDIPEALPVYPLRKVRKKKAVVKSS